MKKVIILICRVFSSICRRWRSYCFFLATKQEANIIGKITLINRNLYIGDNCTIYPGVMFWGDGPIVIGDNVNIGKDCIIYASRNGGVSIGNDTNIAAQCYIIDMDHGTKLGMKIAEQENLVEAVTIGSDCWIGANVTILKGSVIGDGAVIGAKALVKSTIEKNVVAVGIPAKIIKERR